MAERNNYAQPMDFEYENKHGAVDPSSPFVTAIKNHSSFASSQGDLGTAWRLQSGIDQRQKAVKRPFAQYESPQKSQAPALRPPGDGQSVLFSAKPVDTNKKLPPKPLNNIWNTPRSSKPSFEFSSGGETPDTENWRADSEATPDTPSMGLSKGFKNLFGKSNGKNKDAVANAGSPGKAELVRAPYSQKAAARVQKRREKESSKRRRLFIRDAVESETDADTNAGAHRPSDKTTEQKKGWDVGGFFHYLEAHPDLPRVLSYYAQLSLNIFLIFGLMYIFYSFWSTIRSDVDKKSNEAMAEVLAEIAVCAKHWKDNHCDKGTPLPALEVVCREWEKCMNKDHKSIGRARVSAHTFAEIFNSFIEPISWKAMGFTMLVIFGCFLITNVTFGLFRRHHDAHPPYMPPVPPTPQRHASWEQYGYTPYGSQYSLPPPQWGQLEPAPSIAASPRKDRSPRKQKQLEL